MVSKMIKFLFIIGILAAVQAQENALRNLPPMLRECYTNRFLLERDNRLPHTLNTLLAIVRKAENTQGPNLDLRTLTLAILHGFRQDGIVPNPNVPISDGVTPFAPNGFQFFKHAQTLRFLPGNAINFPNNTLTAIERCSLHFMISSSAEVVQRGDEGRVCRFAGAYRSARSIESDEATSTVNDVETLSPDVIEKITKHKDSPTAATVDPNSMYPEYPHNHPITAQMSSLPKSKCPVENGVVRTRWGGVSAGLVLAGIAAGLQQETVTLRELQMDEAKKSSFPLNLDVDNTWLVTLAGDLAEVALMQGPQQMKPAIGTYGNWNSTAMPKWYFLNNNEDVEYTLAEVKGGLDGLILSSMINDWYTKLSGLRLSQVLDMYYSGRGVFDRQYRACNRRTLLTAVAPNSTISAQAYSAALVLNADLTEVTLDYPKIEQFAVEAASALLSFIPSSMPDEISCAQVDKMNDFNEVSVDLTIILDTNWPFESIQPIIATLLDNLDMNQYNSNYTIINGYDGTPMINSTYDILEFFQFNSSDYKNFTRGFDLSKSLEKLNWSQLDKLDKERNRGAGGGRSNVVLVIPHLSPLQDADKEFCLQKILKMREVIPDLTLLMATYSSKDTWSSLVRNSQTDLFLINVGDTPDAQASLEGIITRIKQVPKRLFNSQCGSDYVTQGSSAAFDDYVEPFGVNFYRLHPNYFYNTDTTYAPTVKIQASPQDIVTVCSSRDELHLNATEHRAAASCTTLKNNEHTITLSCADAYHIHECPPLYLSISANSTNPSYSCTDRTVCRFQYMVKYTISYEHLVCVNSGHQVVMNSTILALIISYLFYYSL